MSVFTVFCHGTGFNRIKGTESDELVAYFHNNIQGTEATLANSQVGIGNYLINEGPGHGGNGLAQPQQVNPMTGGAKGSTKHFWQKKTLGDHASGNVGSQQIGAGVRGKLAGTGWDENTQRTVNVIQELVFGHGQQIDTVNLVGWSRGAVTCIRIAHMMKSVFDTTIRCNIFAVDPVAGNSAGEKMVDAKEITDNVSNFVGILSMHERRGTFSPQDLSRVTFNLNATKCIFLPMPGVHNAQVIVNTPPDSAWITRNLACGLLRSWGTQITTTPYQTLSSPQAMTVAYGRLVLSLSESKSFQSKGIGSRVVGGMSLVRRDFAKTSKMDLYTHGGKSSYWINEHHRACFQAAYPDVYKAIFTGNPGATMQVTLNSRMSDFCRDLITYAPLRESLVAKGLLEENSTGVYTLMMGGGSRYGGVPANNMWRPMEWPLTA